MSPPYSKAQWRTILQNAHKALAADHTNIKAQAAMKAAISAIGQEVPPTESATPDMGELAAGRIGLSQGLAGAAGGMLGGAAAGSVFPGVGTFLGGLGGGILGAMAVKPAAEALSAAPASDVAQQWNATTQAHPGWQTGGQLLGGIGGSAMAGGASRLVDNAAIRGARRQILEAAARRASTEPGIPSAAIAGSPTADEAAIMQQLGMTLNQVQGRTGSAAFARRPVYTPSTPAQAAPDALRSLTDAQLTAMSPPAPLMEAAGTPTAATSPASLLAEAPGPMQVAKSYEELRRLLRAGVPREQIRVDYWTRGGRLEQSVPPLPKAAPPSLAATSTNDLIDALRSIGDPAHRVIIRNEIARRAGLVR